jgi:hypothetical protein
MSAATAPAARTGRAGSPARAPGAARHPAPRPTPRLRAVPAPAARRPLAPFLLVTVGLAVAGLVGLLLLNTLVAQDSFRLSALQRDNRALAEREQVLVARVSALDAPGGLARRAEKLGMVPSGAPAFLDLRTGRSMGKATKARAPVRPAAGTAKPAKPAAEPARTAKQGSAPATPAAKPKVAVQPKVATATKTVRKAPAKPTRPAAGRTATRKVTG